MNEKLPGHSSEVPKDADAQVDIEIDIDPAMYIVGAQEKPAAQADQGTMVGENYIVPASAGKQEHISLPLGENEEPGKIDIYNRMVGGPNVDTDQGIMVGENFIVPATADRQEHISLPLGENEEPGKIDIYNRMVGGRGDERPDISI